MYFDDIRQLFPEKKKNTLYWDIYKLVDAGYIKRVRHGVYRFNENRLQPSTLLSVTAKEIMSLLDETGFDYYISGIDILSKFLLHTPESYPVMVFVQSEAFDEVAGILQDNGFFISEKANDFQKIEAISGVKDSRKIVDLNKTNSFLYAKDNLAITEKAFLDLFFAITRKQYPFALQEMVRVYLNMVRNGAVDKKKLVKVSYARNMQYDIRFIVESKYISDSAFRFVSIMKEEDF